MRIDHIAMWVLDLERMRMFYEKYFHAKAGQRYHNPTKNFSSYFLTFADDCRLEIMSRPDIFASGDHREKVGFTHLAISVGSEERVNSLTEILRGDGFAIIGEPRTTGDGYYESVVLDPENNRIEITV
jgi:lactoylglutathione lyase